MKKNNESDGVTEKFGKCQTCLGYIPIEHYFGVGDLIDCSDCETSYIIESKSPVKLSMIDDDFEVYHYEDDDYEDDDYDYEGDHYEDDFREMSFEDR